MPTNCLSQSYVAGDRQAAVCPLYDPDGERDSRRRFRREAIPELAWANSFAARSGGPTGGWVLVRRRDLAGLDLFATDLQLRLDGFLQGVPELVLNGLSLVQSRCVSRGRAADPDAIYLLELCDGRGLTENRWFSRPLTAYYNVRAPAYPTDDPDDPAGLYSASLDGGTAWTWDGIAQDLWERMPPLGAYPGLPVTPLETAENFSFPGASNWQALALVLSHLGCAVGTDLTDAAAPYSVVQYGAADPAFAALQTRYAGLLEDDLEFVEGGAGRVPGSYTVFFHRRNRYYGTEETVRRDAAQWWTTPLYSLSVTATAAGFPQFAAAPGVGRLWAEFAVRFDEDGNPLAADAATAAAVAAERAAAAYTRVYRGTLGSMRRDYAGALPFFVGSQADGVLWRQTESTGRLGWRTTTWRGPQPDLDGWGVLA